MVLLAVYQEDGLIYYNRSVDEELPRLQEVAPWFGVIALERLISKIYVKRIAKGSVRDGIETVRWGSFTGMQELDLLNKINIFTLLNIFLCLN